NNLTTVTCALSSIWMATEKATGVVGVGVRLGAPVISPVVAPRLRPFGSWPRTTFQAYGGLPPDASSLWPTYCCPTCAGGSGVGVVIASGVGARAWSAESRGRVAPRTKP